MITITTTTTKETGYEHNYKQNNESRCHDNIFRILPCISRNFLWFRIIINFITIFINFNRCFKII